MPFYQQVGEISRKRHTRFRQPDGSLYHEELIGEEGFSYDSSLLYHLNPPTALSAITAGESEDQPTTKNHPLRPRHFKTHELKAGGDLVSGRHLLLANEDVCISYVVGRGASELTKNAMGDELVFIEEGDGVLESVFGALPFVRGDYLVVPSSTIHRWVVAAGKEVRALVIETGAHISSPKRYLSRSGQFLEHAPYCERDIRSPRTPLLRQETEVPVLVRHRNGLTRYVYQNHPFDVVGWDGCLYPYAFSIFDFEPITGRIHQPPPVHQVFEAPGLVVCNFVPRKFDYHPESVPAPYYHSNVDSDEVLFYVEGQFASRRGSGIDNGSVSLHPGGHTHGPQPGSITASLDKEETHEYAVMVDTFRPLDIGPGGRDCEQDEYAWSWLEGR